MNKKFIVALMLAWPLVSYAQQTETGTTVLRDKKGIIQAIEFSESKELKVMSDQEFMKQYLKTTVDDGLVKAKDKQRSTEYADDHFDQFIRA